MSEEKEIHRGELRIGFHREPIVLTTRCLKTGTTKNQEEVLLSDILEAYTKTESGFGGTWSKLAIRLKDGRELLYLIIAEEQQGAEILFQTSSTVFSNASMLNKSTQDRWVNLINRLLTNKEI